MLFAHKVRGCARRQAHALGGIIKSVALCAFAGGMLAEAALAQSSGEQRFDTSAAARAHVEALKLEPIGSATDDFGIEVNFAQKLEYSVITFHRVQDRRDPTSFTWRARRSLARGNRASTALTDEHRCPTMLSVLQLAEGFEPPRIDLAGIPEHVVSRDPDAEPNIILDDQEYVVSARFASFLRDRTSAKLRMAGGTNTPIGAFVRSAVAALEPCWSSPASR